MLTILRKCINWFADYMRRTIKNKVCALGIMGFGIVVLLNGEATFCVFMLAIGVWLFFAREDMFV